MPNFFLKVSNPPSINLNNRLTASQSTTDILNTYPSFCIIYEKQYNKESTVRCLYSQNTENSITKQEKPLKIFKLKRL